MFFDVIPTTPVTPDQVMVMASARGNKLKSEAEIAAAKRSQKTKEFVTKKLNRFLLKDYAGGAEECFKFTTSSYLEESTIKQTVNSFRQVGWDIKVSYREPDYWNEYEGWITGCIGKK